MMLSSAKLRKPPKQWLLLCLRWLSIMCARLVGSAEPEADRGMRNAHVAPLALPPTGLTLTPVSRPPTVPARARMPTARLTLQSLQGALIYQTIEARLRAH